MGKSVAIVGAGGIGFDIAEFLAHGADAQPMAEDRLTRGTLTLTLALALTLTLTLTLTLALTLTLTRPHAMPSVASFLAEYGIDPTNTARGGLVSNLPQDSKVEAEPGGGDGGGEGVGGGEGGIQREIFLLQRKTGKHGAGLGRTTGWIHRLDLRKMGVTMLGGVSYDKAAMPTMALRTTAMLTTAMLTTALLTMALLTMAMLTTALLTMALLTTAILTTALLTCDKVDDDGLHIRLKGNPKKGEPPSSRVLEVDTVVVCAGQISQQELEKPLQAPGVP